MFKGILSSDLKLLPGLLKKELNTHFQIDDLIDSNNARLNEAACHKLCLDLVAKVNQTVIGYYQKAVNKQVDSLTKSLDENKNDYINLLLTELYKNIKTNHKKCIQKNLPVTLDIETISKKIKLFSNKPQRGIGKQAVVDFLSTHVFMYRSGLNKQPLQQILNFFQKEKKAFNWLKDKIRDNSTKLPEQHWPTGNHEWIPCHLILDVLKRSAGMINNITPYVVRQTEQEVIIVDWLTIHSEMRSPIQHLYFKNDKNNISSGHTPSVRDRLEGPTFQGIQTTGSNTFHNALRKEFYSSTTPREFVRKMPAVEQEHLISGKKHLKPTRLKFFTSEGVKTNNEKSVNLTRHEKIRPEYKDRRALFSLYSDLSVNGTDGDEIKSIISDETEYSTPESERRFKNVL